MIDLVTYKHNFFTSVDDIIEVPVSKEMSKFAKDNAHVGPMNSKSLTKGQRTFGGVLGEIATLLHLPTLIDERMLGGQPNGDYDFRYGSITIDTKNKHFKNVQDKNEIMSLPYNESSIFAYEAKKKCEIYLFTTTPANSKSVFLKGWIQKKDLVKPENLVRAGSPMKGTGGDWHEDNYVVDNIKLHKMSALKAFLQALSQKDTLLNNYL
jgi:hypothetical protein